MYVPRPAELIHLLAQIPFPAIRPIPFFNVPAALPPGKTRYLLYRRLGGTQSRSGRVRTISAPNGIQFPDRPARSESLYPLSYPGSSGNCLLIPKLMYVGHETGYVSVCSGEFKNTCCFTCIRTYALVSCQKRRII